MYVYDERKTLLSLQDINQVVYIYITVAMNCMMTAITYCNLDIIYLIQTMKSSKYRPKSPAQDAFVRGWKRVAVRLQNFYILGNGFLLVAVIVLALYKGERTLFVAHVPSFLNWKVFFCSQILMSVYTCQMTANYASILTTFLIELLIQTYLLKEDLVEMSDIAEFKECLQWHQLLLLLRKKIQRFCSIGMTVVFLLGVIIMCTTMSLLTQGETADVAFLFPYVSVLVLIILGACWCGSEVMSQSDGISFCIYSSQWTDSDVSYMKLIKMQLLFAKDPMKIYLGGGVTTMSLPLFVTIMKTTYTVFTLLQGFQDSI
ncbi:unnamed protein product [Callosobruchus maculatus]|uniref:Odorant receptor n=1 Tax=Callosobruchus maculatus TaxID=64391 RepID=A0A653DE27_CALMS|nr:unnamed protein product [Callosobruchus maculatus]